MGTVLHIRILTRRDSPGMAVSQARSGGAVMNSAFHRPFQPLVLVPTPAVRLERRNAACSQHLTISCSNVPTVPTGMKPRCEMVMRTGTSTLYMGLWTTFRRWNIGTENHNQLINNMIFCSNLRGGWSEASAPIPMEQFSPPSVQWVAQRATGPPGLPIPDGRRWPAPPRTKPPSP